MRQSACLVFNPITVNNFASLFNCTPVGGASDSMMAPTWSYFSWFGPELFVCCLAHRGSTVGFLLLQCSSGVVGHPRDLQVSVATHFCRVLIFASTWYLSAIYLFHVMIHWWVRKPPRGPNNCVFWAMVGAGGGVGYPWGRFEPPTIFILTVLGRCFCCGSLLLLVLDVCIYTLVQVLC